MSLYRIKRGNWLLGICYPRYDAAGKFQYGDTEALVGENAMMGGLQEKLSPEGEMLRISHFGFRLDLRHDFGHDLQGARSERWA